MQVVRELQSDEEVQALEKQLALKSLRINFLQDLFYINEYKHLVDRDMLWEVYNGVTSSTPIDEKYLKHRRFKIYPELISLMIARKEMDCLEKRALHSSSDRLALRLSSGPCRTLCNTIINTEKRLAPLLER